MTPKLHHALTFGLALCAGCFRVPDALPLEEDEGGSSDTGMAEASTSAGADQIDSGSSDDEDPAAESTGEPQDDTTGEVPEDLPLEILSFEPADGSTHVYDETVTIEFSEPVAPSTLEAAFPQGSAFDWSDDGTRVAFEIPFAFETTPVLQELVVPTSVTDLEGNELLEPFESSFELASIATTTIDYDPEASTVVSVFGDWLWIGDYASNELRHGGISFPMAALPPSALAIRGVTFDMDVSVVGDGVLDPAFGSFVVDHVAFDDPSDIDTPTILDQAFATVFEPGGAAVGPIAGIDVTDQFSASWAATAWYFQLRIHPEASNGDGEGDYIAVDTMGEARPRVEVEYLE